MSISINVSLKITIIINKLWCRVNTTLSGGIVVLGFKALNIFQYQAHLGTNISTKAPPSQVPILIQHCIDGIDWYCTGTEGVKTGIFTNDLVKTRYRYPVSKCHLVQTPVKYWYCPQSTRIGIDPRFWYQLNTKKLDVSDI